jgi:hypothetical protein
MKGAVGVLASTLSVLTSLQENVEHIARVASLVGGFTVAVLTSVSIVRGWRKRK